MGVSGKAAAMNKMALLGEEWPEEEDLPCSSSKSSVLGPGLMSYNATSINKLTPLSIGGDTASKAVMKDVKISQQRGNQRSAAKKKYETLAYFVIIHKLAS